MKREVLVLTGACGVGKSTIGRLWAQSKGGVCVEGDTFTQWIHDDRPRTTDYFLNIEEMIADVAYNTCHGYLKHGFSTCIEFVWTSQGLLLLKNSLESCELVDRVKFVYLKCDLDENKDRDRKRSADHQMNERVGVVRAELEEQKWPDFVHILDSSGVTVEDTLQAVLSL